LLCFLFSWGINKNIQKFLTSLQVLEVLTLLVFLVQDIFLFYIFFEIILIPMFYIIISWGPNDRKIKAAFYFFIYTFFGSILLLFTIFLLFNEIGSTNFSIILSHQFNLEKQKILALLLFFSFSIKIPMIPFHL
jgi:NADH:ubiquinone oxidoreductase subunit 4 (subunit M)